MKSEFTELVLTCGSWQEAQRIADALLEKQLVACVEMLDVHSKFHWQGHIDAAKEVKLIMKSVANNFGKIEEEVAKLHSYGTFCATVYSIAADLQRGWGVD
jgi:periplasmic divalent cation tolerance protein